ELQYVPAHEHRALFRFLESRDLRHGAAACGSLRLKPRELHHLAPLLGFLGDEPTQRGRRAGKRLAAYFGKLCAHRGIAQRGVDLPVEFIDDLDRRGFRSGDAVPLARFVTRHKISPPPHPPKPFRPSSPPPPQPPHLSP